MLVRGTFEYIASLPSESAAAIFAGVFAVSSATAVVLLTRYFERRRALEQALRDKKVPLYEEFVAFWMKALNRKGKPPISEQEMRQFFVSFTQKLMTWGSDGFVLRWSRFRRKMGTDVAAEQASMAALGNLLEFEALLMEIRREFGHANEGLEQGDLLGLFVNDIDSVLGKRTSAVPSADDPVAAQA